MTKDMASALEAFASASTWSVNEIFDKLNRWKAQVVTLEGQLRKHELSSKDLHKKLLDVRSQLRE